LYKPLLSQFKQKHNDNETKTRKTLTAKSFTYYWAESSQLAEDFRLRNITLGKWLPTLSGRGAPGHHSVLCGTP